jgi:hypothetical protein
MIHPVPSFGRPLDHRTDDDRELARIKKEYEAEQQRIKKEASRKKHFENEARAEKLLAGRSRVYATKIATRANTSWLTWSGIRSAMESLHVEMHPIKDGGYVISMPDPSTAGENIVVGGKLAAARQSAHRLIDVIEGSFGLTVAADKQPKCAVPECLKGGEFPTRSSPVEPICYKHSGHRE